MLTVSLCPNCGSDKWYVFAATPGDGRLHMIQCRCPACRLVFSNPQASQEEVASYYGHVCAMDQFFEEDFERVRTAAARTHLGEISAFKTEGRLLDIGASIGVFMSQARDAGFDVVGIEPSGKAAAHARERFGLEILPGFFHDHEFEPGSFDVVYAWHVIEHVTDLDSFLTGIHRVLRPGGVLYLGTESYLDLNVAVLRLALSPRGRVLPFLTSAEHTLLFTPSVLRDCQTRRGFRVVSVKAYDEVGVEDRVASVTAGGIRGKVRRALPRVSARVDPALGWGPYLRSLALRR